MFERLIKATGGPGGPPLQFIRQLACALLIVKSTAFVTLPRILSSGDVHQWRPNQKTPATEWEAKIDQLFAEQARETDPEKRKSEFREIQRIVADASPVIPIVARHVVAAANLRVGNLAPSPMFPYSLWNVDELFIK